jgi:hypothetical protein
VSYVFIAKNAAFDLQPGATPQIHGRPKRQPLEARFIQFLHLAESESRFQRLFTSNQIPGAMPQADSEIAPSAVNTYRSHSKRRDGPIHLQPRLADHLISGPQGHR